MDIGQKLKKMYGPHYRVLVEEYYKTFMDRVRMMREAREPHNRNIKEPLTQVAVATALDIIPQNYNKIERGKRGGGINLSVEHAIRISVLYGCSIDWLITGREYGGDPVAPTDNAGRELRQLEEALETERKLRRLLEAENERLRTQLDGVRQKSRR